MSVYVNESEFMASVSSIKTDITDLSDYQLQELFNYIGEMLTLGSLKGSLDNDFKESRFSKGEVFPHCQLTPIVKNGKLNGKQRYLCKSCILKQLKLSEGGRHI